MESYDHMFLPIDICSSQDISWKLNAEVGHCQSSIQWDSFNVASYYTNTHLNTISAWAIKTSTKSFFNIPFKPIVVFAVIILRKELSNLPMQKIWEQYTVFSQAL